MGYSSSWRKMLPNSNEQPSVSDCRAGPSPRCQCPSLGLRVVIGWHLGPSCEVGVDGAIGGKRKGGVLGGRWGVGRKGGWGVGRKGGVLEWCGNGAAIR